MIRVTIAYPHQTDAIFNYEYYVQNHMKLVKDRLSEGGLVRAEVDKAIAGGNPKEPAPYLGICHMYFNSLEDFQKGIGTHGREIMGDIPNYTNVQPQIQISEIVEI